eukprot:363843-Chlamydomonas_euryale.AAC.7
MPSPVPSSAQRVPSLGPSPAQRGAQPCPLPGIAAAQPCPLLGIAAKSSPEQIAKAEKHGCIAARNLLLCGVAGGEFR